jgi:hypothetical protein
MQTCEKCSASFEPPKDVTEVTSLRILCPKCAAERAAAKAARTVAPASQPVSAAAKVAAPSAPKAAPKPVAEKPPEAVPAARVVKSSKADATGPKDAAPAKPAKRPAKHKHHVDTEELHERLQKKGSREVLFAFIGAVVMLTAAGVVLWKVLGQHQDEAKAAQAYQDRVEAFKAKYQAYDIEAEATAKELIRFADENKELWFNADFASDVMGRVAKAKTNLENQEEKRTLEQRLAEVEAILAKAAEIPPSELAEQRRRLDELTARSGVAGAEFQARLAKDREDAEKIYVERLVTSAEAAAATDPLDRAALSTIQLAEDELFKLFEASYKAWTKNNQDPTLAARKDEHQTKYQAVVRLSDDAVSRFFTPAVIDGMPWRDLLASDQVAQWKWAEVKGFEHRIENGTLHLIGPDPSEKSEGIGSIGDREVWRDFLIEAEFTITKGVGTLYFRMPLVWQENILSHDLLTDEGHLELERAYTYAFTLLGSTMLEEDRSEDTGGPTVSSISWTKPRKGAFGLSLPKDSEIKFTRLRAKILR